MAMINAESREGTGKGVARKMRREGRIPAVLYGAGRENLNLSLSAKEWIELVEKNGSSLRTQRQTLVLDGKARQMVLLRGFQVHPVTENPLHVDFTRFNPNQRVEIEVPVLLVGEEVSRGVKDGGILQQIRRELEVQCLAGDIPEHIEISVAHLEIGDSIHIEDVVLPEGVLVNHEVNFTIATVGAPHVEAADDGSEEGAGSESAAE
ncbi:MAG: 50S ribosomal protein L25/general stress protein Ctc [Magnetococcales bacterium]|nr:50S ribosomal protein L25/general stress protein Ctc [Magnetococcales bacterium]